MCLSQGRVDGVAAIVGNNIVLHSDVLQQAQFVAMGRRVDPSTNPYLFENIYLTTLENIINQYAVLDVAAKDTNIVVSNDEVDRALNQQIDDFIFKAGSEELFLEMAGMSMRQIRADYWQDIRDMMVVERFQYSKIQNVDVSRVEVLQFYNSFKDSIPPSPEKYSFSIIEIPFSAGAKSDSITIAFLGGLKEQVEFNAASFDSIAQIYSQDPGSAPSGGYLGFTTRGSLVKEYEEVAYSMEVGEISSPVKSEFGYHLIKLIDKQGEKISTQHILRTTVFTNEDKLQVYKSVYDIYSKTINEPDVFDSLSTTYSTIYKNSSGKYSNLSKPRIPDYIFSQLQLLNYNELSQPIEVEGGYLLVYFHKHQGGFFPNTDNSWDLIYNYAKQKKQNTLFSDWVEDIKANIYIKTFNN
ncbi:MAG: peptidylprolyl isomerase [Candidatus Marinimicrobia bacterium]|nr:peptidylprolyl isomerase [Candidatus Neomarinimicrobiota bacterium]